MNFFNTRKLAPKASLVVGGVRELELNAKIPFLSKGVSVCFFSRSSGNFRIDPLGKRENNFPNESIRKFPNEWEKKQTDTPLDVSKP